MATSTTQTASDRVLKTLRAARRGSVTIAGQKMKTPGGWVTGATLNMPEVGGSSGLRRLRDLRAAGHTIEKRRVPGSHAYQYRIVQAKTN